VIELRLLATSDLTDDLVIAIRGLMDEAFGGGFSDDDWEHTIGGIHAVVLDGGRVVSHGSVVARTLVIGDRMVRAGYIEGVATAPSRQRQGHGSRVMSALGEVVAREFETGALSTGEHRFYERLGWERWRGPTFVRRADGSVMRTADEDDGIMTFRVGTSHWCDPTLSLTCEERPGDDW
jgi:aminoglycoside 2'-N-acetyltransferase I